MANKMKRVSINALEKTVKENTTFKTENISWNGLEFQVKNQLDLTEMRVFVSSVARACFNEANASYNPEMKDFAIRSIVIELYTNLNLPSNLDRLYNILYGSDLVFAVYEHIDRRQFDVMMHAIDERIDALVDANISTVNRQIDLLQNAMSELGAKFTDMFDGVEAGDIQKLLGAVAANGGFDEEKVVNAVLAAQAGNASGHEQRKEDNA